MSDKRSLLANADGSDDEVNNNNSNNNDGSEGSSGDVPVAIARPQQQAAIGSTTRGSAEDERFTLSELMARDGGNVRDADARAMASMRQEREKAQHEEETLDEHADMVLTIMKPVSITM